MEIQMSGVIFFIIIIWLIYSAQIAIFAAIAPTEYKKEIKKITEHYYWKIIAAMALGPVLILYSSYIYEKERIGNVPGSGILEIPPKNLIKKEECK